MSGSGFYTAYAIAMLNTLVGNLNVRGGLVLDAGMKPVWTLVIHPTFNSIDQSVIEYFELEVHGHGYKLLDVRERAQMPVDATGWSIVINELRIESTMDALKRTEPPAG